MKDAGTPARELPLCGATQTVNPCRVSLGQWQLSAHQEGMRRLRFALLYTKAVGQIMTMDITPLANEPAPREGHRKSRSVSSWVLGGLLGAILTVILLGALVWLSTGLGLFRLLGNLHGDRTQFNVDQPTVVHQIQQLQRLETVSYTMDKIISGEHGNAYLPKFLAGDRLLLVVHGEVVGGINLANLQPGDVQIEGHKVSIHLPAAEVLRTRIDNAKTRVYSRDTGLFTSPDPNLESEVREEAELQLRQAALQDGILKIAADNARTTISSMLKGFGFLQVDTR